MSAAGAAAAGRAGAAGADRATPPGTGADAAVRALLAPVEPVAVERTDPCRHSSHPLERVHVTLADGAALALALKRLGRGPRGRRIAQPGFLVDPQREPAVYGRILSRAPTGPPAYHGSWAGPAGERWLLVEWVRDGRELWQVGDLRAWAAAARWLGAFHTALAPDVDAHTEAGRLLAYDAAYYRRWLQRALRFARERGRASEAARFLAHLARGHDAIVETLLALPATVVHGDFNAANVLVAPAAGGGVRIAAVDWELAAAGPGLVDLATLVSGDWSAADRALLVAAYAASAVPHFSARELACARLHIALRWLGWAAPGWRPPPAQRHDWLADAVALSQELGL